VWQDENIESYLTGLRIGPGGGLLRKIGSLKAGEFLVELRSRCLLKVVIYVMVFINGWTVVSVCVAIECTCDGNKRVVVCRGSYCIVTASNNAPFPCVVGSGVYCVYVFQRRLALNRTGS
jgi:hypothetical protein